MILGLTMKSIWKFKKIIKNDDNSDTSYQNLWHTAKAMLRGNFIVVNAYIIKPEKL